MTKFNKAKEKNLNTLRQYVPIVARVHGGTHPEFHDVHKVFNEIIDKLEGAGNEKPALEDEFKKLREITSNYTIPDDVCETYEAVYNMLAELDEAYKG